MASKKVIQKDYADCTIPPEIFQITPSFYHSRGTWFSSPPATHDPELTQYQIFISMIATHMTAWSRNRRVLSMEAQNSLLGSRRKHRSIMRSSELVVVSRSHFDCFSFFLQECKKYIKWMESRTAARSVELAGLRRKRLSRYHLFL